MAVIHELSSHMADLIAAGEVVERPSSVAKELVENAIDAGATRITIEMESGGITYLRITDNGCGMSPEDAPIAFRRHATSKLRTQEDLTAIGTLGFRGEALAAIASVSRIDLFTKPAGALAGTHIQLEAGEIVTCEEAGCPDGTTIVVRDLFFNTPARMKFLKKDFTEAGYITGVVQHAALSHPEISFTLRRDGKQTFSTAGDGKLITPVFGVFGREMTENMVSCEPFERDGLRAWGYITKAHFCRPNRSMQHFFVNGRYIRSRLLQAALEEAYRNKIITGKYPSCALFVTMPLGLVDVNVHPAKTEVKFAQERAVFHAVYVACKNTLEQHDNAPVLHASAAEKPAVREDHVTQEQQRLTIPANPAVAAPESMPQSVPLFADSIPATPPHVISRPALRPPVIDCDYDEDDTLSLCQPSLSVQQPIGQLGVRKIDPALSAALHSAGLPQAAFSPAEAPVTGADAPARPAVSQSHARVIGEAFHTYILTEDGDGLALIDKHAAHERLIFNRLRAQTEIPTQQLLTPHVAEMNASEYAVLSEQLPTLEQLGFEISSFGERSFAVRAIPAYLDAGDISAVLSEIADKMMSSRAPVPDRLDDLIHTVSCKAAIKAGSGSSLAELQTLCDQVLDDPDAASCPHGRPTVVRLTKYELDKLFKRVNQ